MNYYLRRPVLAAIFASTACMASIPTASAGPFTDWLFGPFRQQPAVPVGAPQYVGPPLTGIPQTQAAWLPPAGYSTQWNRAAVTNYRPVTSLDPATGTTVTRMMPCTSYELQAQRVPMLSLRPVLGGYSYPQATRWPSLTAPYAGSTPVPSSMPLNGTSLNSIPTNGLQGSVAVQPNVSAYSSNYPAVPYASVPQYSASAPQYGPMMQYGATAPYTTSSSYAPVVTSYPTVPGATQATALMPTINMPNRPWPNYAPAAADTSIPSGSMFPIPAYSQPGTVPINTVPTNGAVAPVPAYPQTAYYSQPMPLAAPSVVPSTTLGTTQTWVNSGAPSYSQYGSVLPSVPVPYGVNPASDWGYGSGVPAPGLSAPLTNDWQPTLGAEPATNGALDGRNATQPTEDASRSNVADPESTQTPSLPRDRETESSAQGASMNRFPLRNLTRETMTSESKPMNDAAPVAPDLLPTQSTPADLHPIPAPKDFPEPKWNPGLLDVRDRTASVEPPVRKTVETFAVYQAPVHETFKPIQWTSAEIDVREPVVANRAFSASSDVPAASSMVQQPTRRNVGVRSETINQVRPANAVRLRPSTEK